MPRQSISWPGSFKKPLPPTRPAPSGKAQQTRHLALELLAQKRQKELEKRGIRSELLREEPFTTAQDSIEFKVHLMIWEKGVWNRKARIETWEDK